MRIEWRSVPPCRVEWDRAVVTPGEQGCNFYLTLLRTRIDVNAYTIWCVDTSPADLTTAFRIEDESRLGFWDTLIVASALKSGANRTLSEDLNAGQMIAGIRIENPFAGARD